MPQMSQERGKCVKGIKSSRNMEGLRKKERERERPKLALRCPLLTCADRTAELYKGKKEKTENCALRIKKSEKDSIL